MMIFSLCLWEKNISRFYHLNKLNKPPENLASKYEYITPSNDYKLGLGRFTS